MVHRALPVLVTTALASIAACARPAAPAQLPSPETCPSGLDLRIAGTVAIPPPDSDADDVDPAELRRVPAFHEAMLDPTRAALLGPHDADRDLDTAEVTKLDLDPRPSSVLLLAADGTRCRGTAGAFRLQHDEEGPALLSLWRVIDGCAPVPDRTSAAAIRDADTHAACVAFPVLEAPETAIQAVRVADPTHRPRSCQAPSCDEKNRVTTSGSAQHSVVQILRWSIPDVTKPPCEWAGEEQLDTWENDPPRMARIPLTLRLVLTVGDARGAAYAVGEDRGSYQIVDLRRPAVTPLRPYTSHHEEVPGYTLRPQCGG